MFDKINRIAIKLYSGCNMNCSYCFQSFMDKYSPKEFTAFDDLYKFLIDIPFSEKVIVTFCGGEMTLKPNLIKDCQLKVFKKIEKKVEVKFEYAIITNGTNIDVLLSLFDDHTLNPNYCNLSWDGLYSVSKSRHCTQFTDEDLRENIKKIGKSDYNDQLSIVHALTPSTINHLAESFEYCLDNDVLSFGYYPIHEANYSDDFHKSFEEQLNKLYQMVINGYKHHKTINCFNIHTARLKQEPYYFTCKKLGYNYYINPNGIIYPCIYFGDNGLYKLGDLKLGIDKQSQQAFIKDYLKYPNCDYKQCKCTICGECPAACAVHKGNMNIKFKNLCKIREIENNVYNQYKGELDKYMIFNDYCDEDFQINDNKLVFSECELESIIKANYQPHFSQLQKW